MIASINVDAEYFIKLQRLEREILTLANGDRLLPGASSNAVIVADFIISLQQAAEEAAETIALLLDGELPDKARPEAVHLSQKLARLSARKRP